MENNNTLEKDMSFLQTEQQKPMWEQSFTEEDSAYSYWLDRIPGIGRKTIAGLLRLVGTPGRLYEASEQENRKWVQNGWMRPEQEQAWQTAKREISIWEEYGKLQRCGIRCIPYATPGYPKRLSELVDAPINLYVKGRTPVEAMPSVGIVGARLCSDYGRYMAKQFGRKMAQAGIQVISGMAMGVDGISQQAALDAGGTSFGVLGCGVDICYPEQNQALYEALIRTGGVLSEYIPGTMPKAGLFPARNRIISGCADVILVIEAREKSGTLITVDAALEQGREVYALPGRVTDSLAAGCNHLIRQGAGIAVSPEYVADAVWEIWSVKYGRSDIGAKNSQKEKNGSKAETGRTIERTTERTTERKAENGQGVKTDRKAALSKREQMILAQLSEQGKTVDELYPFLHRADPAWTAASVSATLMQLCVRKYAHMQNGRFYAEEEKTEPRSFMGK